MSVACTPWASAFEAALEFEQSQTRLARVVSASGDAFARWSADYWRAHTPPPFKRNARRYGR